jgi:O-antigen chain-terminating methyltransferase
VYSLKVLDRNYSQNTSNETETEKSVIDTSAIRSIIRKAEARANIGEEVTPMLQFRGLTQKIARLAGKAVIYLSSFITDKQRSFNRDMIHAMEAVTDSLDRIGNKIVTEKHNETKHEITRLRGEVNTLRNIQDEIKTNLDTITYLENVLKERELRIKDLEQTIKDIKTSFVLREKNLKDRDIQIKDLKKTLIDLKSLYALQEGNINHQVTHIVEIEKFISHLYNRLVFRDKNILPHNLYVSFENKFRGTIEEIKEKQKIYLPYIKKAQAGTEEYPVLDLGCGRGEWLEILKENGLKGAGVDSNHMMISLCQEKGLDVIKHDCVKFLSKQKSNSLGSVTGFHLLEHLPIDILINLLHEIVRVLKPGGVAIFETPNPQNILVGSYSFYMDPTHKKPLPSPLIKFLAEEHGLKNIEILNIHPLPEELYVSGSDTSTRFNEHFYGPQDYAIICYKT